MSDVNDQDSDDNQFTVGQSSLSRQNSLMLNPVIVESVELLNRYIAENTATQSVSMLEFVSTETIGLAMHNAISTQQNAQIANSATTVAACLKILNVPILRASGSGGASKVVAPPPVSTTPKPDGSS